MIEVETGKRICHLPRISVLVFLKLHRPLLQFTWLDNQHLRYSETKNAKVSRSPDTKEVTGYHGVMQWVDIDVRTGKRLRERQYLDDLGSVHERPPRDEKEPPKATGRRANGLFEEEGGYLYYSKAREPIAGPGDAGKQEAGAFSVSPDGGWAVFRSAKHLYVVDGGKKSVRKLIDSGYWFTWLPAKE